MPQTIITAEQVARRAYWVAEIKKLSGRFGDDFDRLNAELVTELASAGTPALLSHVRLCGAIPEEYGHSSSQEKLYSKIY